MKINTLHTFIIVACVGFTPITYAGQGKGHDKFLNYFDANNDGTVTLEEFDKSASERFERMDPDKNGNITQEEFRSYINERRAERQKNKFDRLDANKDGSISQQEFMDARMKKAEKKFTRMDKDGNGIVNTEEFATCKMKKHTRFKGKKGKRIFHHLDKNSDGNVTKAESYEAWSSWFKRIDTNNDNVVSADEINTFREMRRSGKQ